MTTTDTSRENIQKIVMYHIGENPVELKHHADAISALLAERDAALLREKSLKNNTEELRQLRREFNSIKAERDTLRDQLAASRNEALEEAAKDLIDHANGDFEDQNGERAWCVSDDTIFALKEAFKSNTPTPRAKDV
jgi:hypothetical protein